MQFEIMPCTEADAEFIEEQADKAFNAIAPPEAGAEAEEIHYKITDDEGNIIAGCTLEIDGQQTASIYRLWVDEAYRRQGIASALIREAERKARDAGCYLVMVGTFDWQAKPLYIKHGYMLNDTMSGAPKGHEHYFLTKRLDGSSAEYVPSNHQEYEILRGDEQDAEVLSAKLRRFDNLIAPRAHEYISLCKKITDEDGRIIAGFAGGINGWNDTDISVWVEEKYRNRGIGSRLLGAFEREAKENGADTVFLVAYDWNVGFFKKNGYEKVTGILEDYPKGHTMYCMEKPL